MFHWIYSICAYFVSDSQDMILQKANKNAEEVRRLRRRTSCAVLRSSTPSGLASGSFDHTQYLHIIWTRHRGTKHMLTLTLMRGVLTAQGLYKFGSLGRSA